MESVKLRGSRIKGRNAQVVKGNGNNGVEGCRRHSRKGKGKDEGGNKVQKGTGEMKRASWGRQKSVVQKDGKGWLFHFQ